MYISQDIQLHQSATLAPKLQQSVKLLQMTTLEFRQAVQEALASNPFLEEPEEDPDSRDAPAHSLNVELEWTNTSAQGPDYPAPDGCTLDGSVSEGPTLDDAAPDRSEPASVSDSTYPQEYPRASADPEQDPFDRRAATGTLATHLCEALGTLRLSDDDRRRILYLIDALDADGYLRTPIEELTNPDDFAPGSNECEWRTALHHVQHLAEPGIGARDLRECLLLQLRAVETRTTDPVRALAVTLVDEYLPLLAARDWRRIKRALTVDDGPLEQAVTLIQSLDPHPGRRYDNEPAHYVIPEIIVDKSGAQWRVRVNEAAMPRACLHQQYADWFRCTDRGERTALGSELQSARWLLRSMAQRYETILSVAHAIVQHQQAFFDYGDVALKPLLLHEIADELGIHESTVSRATANKYMQTPRGLFEFRHFFSRQLETESGGTCSASAVRALIQVLVRNEDQACPLSDVSLAEALAEHGIIVARRTVTKYRGQLNIPSIEYRKQRCVAAVPA